MLEIIVKKILAGEEITREDALLLYKYPVEELLDHTKTVFEAFKEDQFDFCTIINGKNGSCSEDCKYCAQSSHYDCQIDTYELLSAKTIVDDARGMASKGIGKYSIVTSGKSASEEEIDQLCKVYEELREDVPIRLCASHGLLKEEALVRLKRAGVVRIHNNLETSRNYFERICTTHTYDEKVETIKMAQKLGLEVCSGGIIGLGESWEDRIDMAYELKALNIQSIPLNLLNPIEGTPLYGVATVDEEIFSKSCAIFRLIHPKAIIRLAGGRGLLSDKGRRLFETCINGAITGELLTTTGNDTDNDMKMVREIGYEI